ncbi:MAG: beta-lactamase family protein [Acidobacteriota bacterium]|nr:beta-lactamase family protein [Acidobacteriota bacterium]
MRTALLLILLAAAGPPAAARAFNGVAILAEGDRTLSIVVSGYADRAEGRPLTASARFVIGSLSKQITAAIVMREVEAGRLALTGDVRGLLSHTSTGTFAYSNVGYNTLGQMAERASGRRFSALAAELFTRCGMHETTAAGAGAVQDEAVGYDEMTDGSLAPVNEAVTPASVPSGGIVSTAPDLIRWNACLHEGRAVTPASYAEMTRASASRPQRWGQVDYGFGIQVSGCGGRGSGGPPCTTEYSHGGYVPGYIATLLYYPATKRSLVVLENTSWDAGNMTRAFAPHDAFRDQARQGSPTLTLLR